MMDHTLLRLGVLALAGAIGTLSRYGLGGLTQRMMGGPFPWGTTLVNLLGCLLFGLCWALIEEKNLLPQSMRLPVLTGFMGAFTTFSTWAFESARLLEQGAWMHLGANLVLQPVLGILLFWLGLFLARVAF